MSQLSSAIERRLAEPNQPLLHFADEWITTSRFHQEVMVLQAVLARLSVHVGDRVIIALPNSHTFTVTYIALLHYGATVVPVNPKMPLPELESVIAKSGAVGIIFGDVGAEAQVPAYRTNTRLRFAMTMKTSALPLEAELHVNEGGQNGLIGQWVLSETMPTSEDKPITKVTGVTHVTEDTPAILLFTSGTTGVPKGVLLTHHQVMTSARQVAIAHGLTPEDVSYCFLPMFHINAQVVSLLSTFITHGRLIIEQKFSASHFWATIHCHGVTWVSAVPTVIAILIQTSQDPIVASTLRFVRSASAPLPARQAHRFEARFGVPVIESYGMTEAASQICINPVPPGKRKIGSVGLPCGLDLQVVDDTEQVLQAGMVGEIIIRGGSVITAYAYGGDDQDYNFRNGWFHTGDLGYVDAEGYLYITGRLKEMINRAGQKISPREVEEVIDRHSRVRSVAVIGLPDPLYGEQVVAYIIPDMPGLRTPAGTMERQLADDLRLLCKQNISSYKCPSEFRFVEFIPIGPTGKVQRPRLRQQVLTAGICKSGAW